MPIFTPISHETFEARDVPHLTLEVTEPAALRGVEVVRPADHVFALNPREFINARDKSMNHINARMLLATYVHSDRAQAIDLHLPHTRPLLDIPLDAGRDCVQ